jgi:hypothetical protein
MTLHMCLAQSSHLYLPHPLFGCTQFEDPILKCPLKAVVTLTAATQECLLHRRDSNARPDNHGTPPAHSHTDLLHLYCVFGQDLLGSNSKVKYTKYKIKTKQMEDADKIRKTEPWCPGLETNLTSSDVAQRSDVRLDTSSTSDTSEHLQLLAHLDRSTWAT